MGLWAEVKRTLNSTLGTTDFKPLDKIIEGQRTLAASDSVIQVIQLKETNVGTSLKEFGKFVPKVDGSVRLVTTYNGGASNTEIVLYVYRDGTEVSSTAKKGVPVDSLKHDIRVYSGSEYTIKIRANTGSYNIENINVCANIVDTSLVEVL